MTAPVEPDLDLSHLLTEVPTPPDGAATAMRRARRRHAARRVTAGGAALVVVLAAAGVVLSRGDDRTVRTAGPAATSTLLTTTDVRRVLPEMVATRFRSGREVAPATPGELRILTPSPRAALTRQWTWHGERAVQGQMPDRVWAVTAAFLEFGDEPSATRYLTERARTAPNFGDQVASFPAIPGAVEAAPAHPSSASSSTAVLFPRGRFVYAVSALYGGNHTGEVHQLAVRQAELAPAESTSCPVSAPLTGIADALPQEGDTGFKHVEQTMVRYEPEIRRDFPGVVSLSVDRRNGDVWRGRRGDFTVHRVRDYWIEVHVESPLSCPSDRGALRSYDGVPLHFVVG